MAAVSVKAAGAPSLAGSVGQWEDHHRDEAATQFVCVCNHTHTQQTLQCSYT